MPDTTVMRGWPGRLASWIRDPVAWTEIVQLLKTVLAAVLAWLLASSVLGLPLPFLAPWSALLVVHATVYRTMSRGLQQVAATVIGILIAAVTGTTIGFGPAALALMLLVGFAIGSVRSLRAEATTVAATALLVLTTGSSDQADVLFGRLLDTAIGIGVGLAVNLLIWPPVRDLAAARAIDAVDLEVGQMLVDMSDELADPCGDEHVQRWLHRSRKIERDIDDAWSLVRQAWESGRLNPRAESRRARESREFRELLHGLEQAVAEVRSIVRTLDHSIAELHEWQPAFRERWLGLLRETGEAIMSPDPNRIAEARTGLDTLTVDFSTEHLPGLLWSEYGALVVNLRNVLDAMSPVAERTPIAPAYEPRLSLRG